MLSTTFFGKFYAGAKKLGRFKNENMFSSFQTALTFSLRRKIFRKKLLITSFPERERDDPLTFDKLILCSIYGLFLFS